MVLSWVFFFNTNDFVVVAANRHRATGVRLNKKRCGMTEKASRKVVGLRSKGIGKEKGKGKK